MARYFGTTSHLVGGSVPASDEPLTIACWFYFDLASPNTRYSLVDIHLSTIFAPSFNIGVDGNDTGQIKASSGTAAAETSANITVRTWQHACGVFASSTDRRAFLDGGNKGTDSSTSNASTPDEFTIGRYGGSNPGRQWWGGIAEVGVWNAALSDAEVALLAKGAVPLGVKPQNLVFYAPLIKDEDLDHVGGISLTPTNSPTTAAHPPVFRVPITFVVPPSSLPDVDITPSAAAAGADSVDPTTHQGNLSLTPIAASATGSRVNPSIQLGSVSVAPSPADVVTSSSGSQVQLGSLSIYPTQISVVGARSDPAVQLGPISYTPLAALAAVDNTGFDATVRLGSISITPTAASARAFRENPTVDDSSGNVDVSPVEAIAGADSVAPTIRYGSVSVTPSASTAGADRLDPIVQAGSDVDVTPGAVTGSADSVSPATRLGSISITPSISTAGTGGVSPAIEISSGNITTTPISAGADSISPTVRLGSLSISPPAAESAGSRVNPSLGFSSMSYTPSAAVAASTVVSPVAGAFLMYFPRADIALGGWKDQDSDTQDIYQSIDEDPADDSNFIRSSRHPNEDVYTAKLQGVSTPDVDTFHYLEYRFKKEDTPVRFDLVVRLKQGATVIAAWDHFNISKDYVTARQELTQAQAALISDYGDLYIEFVAREVA